MHPKMSLLKKAVIALILIVITSLLVLNSMFDVVHCNLRRDYAGGKDKFFKEVKEKIERLEKEEMKDAAAVSRLADQYNLLGTYYIEKRLWDLTIDAYNNSMKYGNRSDAAYYSLGLAYANRGVEKNSKDDISKAEFNYRKSVEINRKYFDAKYALSVLLFYHKPEGKDEALLLVNEIVSVNRAYYPARFALGRYNYELGNKEKALSVYQELASDLNRLPPSGIINDYKAECAANITRIMSELSMR